MARAQTDNAVAPLWGYYVLVDVVSASGETRRVLLFKADAHLAHPPWIPGLVQMTQQVLDDSGCGWIYSVGTAGGSRDDVRLGDVSITNSGHILLQKPENAGATITSGLTVTGDVVPADRSPAAGAVAPLPHGSGRDRGGAAGRAAATPRQGSRVHTAGARATS